jgi:hypothetical protein
MKKEKETELTEEKNQDDLSFRMMGVICEVEMLSSFLDLKSEKIDNGHGDDEIYGAHIFLKDIQKNLEDLRAEIFGD